MANVYRLIVVALALFASIWANSAAAAITPTSTFWITYFGTQRATSSSAAATCDAMAQIRSEEFKESITGKVIGGDSTCDLFSNTYNGQNGQFAIERKSVCPANSTVQGSQCVCAAEFKEKDGQCVPINQCEAGEELDLGGKCAPKCPSPLLVRNQLGFCQLKNTPPGLPKPETCSWRADQVDVTQEIVIPALTLPDAQRRCDTSAGTTADTAEGKGCAGTFEADFAYTGYDGKHYARGRFVFNGQGCSTKDEDPSKNTPPTNQPKCPKGQPGTVNGVEVCIPFGDKGTIGKDPNSKTDEETDKDGNKKTTNTNVVTKCENGVCTTTTTTTVNNNGTSTTTTTNTNESQDAYCKKNPSSRNCGGTGSGGSGSGNGNGNGTEKESEWGGGCGAFTCSGDAIQCAISKEIHSNNCKVLKETDIGEIITSVPVGTKSVLADLPGNKEVDVGGIVNASDTIMGGGACFQDKTVQVMGQSITLPISTICPYLSILGNVLVVVSCLVAARIITGRGT